MLSPIDRACAAIVAELFRQGDLLDADEGRIDIAQVDGSFQVEPLVRAVLMSLREMSDFMEQAGGGALAEAIGAEPDDSLDVPVELALGLTFSPETQFDSARDRLAGHAVKVWKAMIDDALDDGDEHGDLARFSEA